MALSRKTIAYLLAGAVLVLSGSSNAWAFRDTKNVATKKYCERIFNSFNLRGLIGPEKISEFETLTAKDVRFLQGRCVISYSLEYDVSRYASVFAQSHDMTEGEAYKFLQEPKGETVAEMELRQALREQIQKKRLPNKFTLRYLYTPSKPSFPHFTFTFEGERF